MPQDRGRGPLLSRAGPQGPLRTACVLPPCHTLSQYPWVMSLLFMVTGKAATPEGQTSHLQALTITLWKVCDAGVCALVLRAQIQGLASPDLETLSGAAV